MSLLFSPSLMREKQGKGHCDRLPGPAPPCLTLSVIGTRRFSQHTDDTHFDQGGWEAFADDHPVLSRYNFDSDQAREDTITWTMHDPGGTRERAIELREQRAALVRADKVYQEKMAPARADLLAKHPQEFRHFSGETGLPSFSLGRPDGTRLLLQRRQGRVTVLRVSVDVAADAALIAPLARELDARVYAEDGTPYA